MADDWGSGVDGWGSSTQDNASKGNTSKSGGNTGGGWGESEGAQSSGGNQDKTSGGWWGDGGDDQSSRNRGSSGGGWGGGDRNGRGRDNNRGGWGGGGRGRGGNRGGWGGDGQSGRGRGEDRGGWGRDKANGGSDDNNSGWGVSGGGSKNDGGGGGWGYDTGEQTNIGRNSNGGGWAGDDQTTGGRKQGDGGGDDGERPAPYRPEELNLEEEAKLQEDTVGENFQRYKEQTVTCIPLGIVKPIEKFEDVIESKLLLGNLKSLHYAEMTPIQKWAMPSIIQGNDIIGCAQTGSGKTAAFLLPILQTILKMDLSNHDPNDDCQNPYCIIISPTRELAKQIYTHAQMLSKDSIVKSCYIYGQIATAHLKAQLSKGCHILVSTLGRLKDFVQRGWIGFKNVKYIILDEGDRLVDEGFTGDIKEIFNHETMPPKEDRQTLFFSATFKKEIQRNAKEYLKDNFVFLTVGRVGAANEDIKQEFLQVTRQEKKQELKKILMEIPETDKTIIFTQTKATADFLAAFFSSLKLSATSIHGDRHQSQREQAINSFKRGDKRFLISSPVGNRGLDLPKVALVINYDLPNSIDEYVHRIGRTGRAGHTGRAISFFDQDRDHEILPEIFKILKEAKQEVPGWMEGGDFTGATTSSGFGASAGEDLVDDWTTSGSNTAANAPTASSSAPSDFVEEDWGGSTAQKRPADDDVSNPPKKHDNAPKDLDEEW